MSLTYIDTSAFVKLVRAEAESTALRAFVANKEQLVSSAILRTEALRAAQRVGVLAEVGRARAMFAEMRFFAIDDELLDNAASLGPAELRTLDAIHVATAWSLVDELDVVITYDKRMADGAAALGLQVAAPT